MRRLRARGANSFTEGEARQHSYLADRAATRATATLARRLAAISTAQFDPSAAQLYPRWHSAAASDSDLFLRPQIPIYF
jgi:hypothetical protein